MKATRARQRGFTFLFWLFALWPILGFAALAIDIKSYLIASAEVRNAADAGALAGAAIVIEYSQVNVGGFLINQALARDPAEIKQAARAAAAANLTHEARIDEPVVGPCPYENCLVNPQDPDEPYAVRVRVERTEPVPVYFLPVFERLVGEISKPLLSAESVACRCGEPFEELNNPQIENPAKLVGLPLP